ncbi:BRCT domain-containing protein [Nonomuraea sp. NPDC050680]|uniref:BRCT domain-containing protein n=1 Tax=Nonomuraea sp. NPDC050680 TaxID=3154630 RepID=UPI0033E9DD66
MDLRGLTVVVAGRYRTESIKKLKMRLQGAGVNVVDEVSPAVDAVIDGIDDTNPNERVRAAERLGVPVLSAEEVLTIRRREPGGSFPASAALEAARHDPGALLALLEEADWLAFEPERDLPLLRDLLTDMEARHGVTDAHRLATDRLRERGARLRHPYTKSGGDFHDYALSPCGRYLATARGVWADEYYDDGPLQVWELATGRLVNGFDLQYGAGWPGYRDTVQWAADGSRVASAYCTNNVGVWDPFGARLNPFGSADVTDGHDAAATFALAPDGRRAYIMMNSGHEVKGCVAALDQGDVFYNDYRLHNKGPEPAMLTAPLPDEAKERLKRNELGFRRVRWSRDGGRLLGHDGFWAAALDLPDGRLRWLTLTVGDVAWSPDDRRAAALRPGRSALLTVLDADTGQPVSDPVIQAEGSLHWGMRGAEARLAVVVDDGGGVDVYDENGGHRYHLPIATTRRNGKGFFDGQERPWAWEPAGEFGACLTGDGRLEVWFLGDEPALARSSETPEGTEAVLWGAGGVLVLIGERTLRFTDAFTGALIGDFLFGRYFDGERSSLDEEFAKLFGMFHADAFPLTDSSWCAIADPAIEPAAALVIAGENQLDGLDGVLAWTIDRRFAWPVRWGRLDVAPDVETARAFLRR